MKREEIKEAVRIDEEMNFIEHEIINMQMYVRPPTLVVIANDKDGMLLHKAVIKDEALINSIEDLTLAYYKKKLTELAALMGKF